MSDGESHTASKLTLRTGEPRDARLKKRVNAFCDRVRDVARNMAGGGARNVYWKEALLAAAAWDVWNAGGDEDDVERPKGWRSKVANRVRQILREAVMSLKNVDEPDRVDTLLALLQCDVAHLARYVLQHNEGNFSIAAAVAAATAAAVVAATAAAAAKAPEAASAQEAAPTK